MAIYKRDIPEIQRIVRSNVDLNQKVCETGVTALHEAIAEGLPEIAKDLIQAGANPNAGATDGVSVLMAAAFYCQDDVVSLLLKKGANVNAVDLGGDTALMQAAQNCTDGHVVARLLRSGASTNSRTKSGWTALAVAAFYGNESAVQQLVAVGAEVDVMTEEGTPLALVQNRVVGRKPSHDRIYAFLRAFTGR
jgi:ankyrin repeat protein